MLESWSMKKLLAIAVLGLLWSESINADHKKGHNRTSLDVIIDSLERQQKSNDRKRIRRLEQEMALQKIKSFCQQKNPSDKRAYNGCLCRSLDSSNIGAKCEDGWREKTKKRSKELDTEYPKIAEDLLGIKRQKNVEEVKNDWRRCSIYSVIKYGKENCKAKK